MNVTNTPRVQLALDCFQPELKFNLILAWAIRVIERSKELKVMLHKVCHGNYIGSNPLHDLQQYPTSFIFSCGHATIKGFVHLSVH